MDFRVTTLSDGPWDSFVADHRGSFLQTAEWGMVMEKESLGVFPLQVIDEDKVILQALAVKLSMKKVSFLYIPYGPVTRSIDAKVWSVFYNGLKDVCHQQRISFCHIEQQSDLPLTTKTSFFSYQPKSTLVLDIFQDKSSILSQMHQKARYNIHLAEKKGVSISVGGMEYLDVLFNLLQKTAKRQEFGLHKICHYKRILKQMSGPFPADSIKPVAKIFVARVGERVAAVSLHIFFGDTATYLHGGSEYDLRSSMAPYLLHDKVIDISKGKNLKYYDFWGIDERRWPGVTRFKKGFGGREVDYPNSCDIVFNPFTYRAVRIFYSLKHLLNSPKKDE